MNANEQPERRHGIWKCFYPLRFQHIPFLAALAAHVLLQISVAKRRKYATQSAERLSKRVRPLPLEVFMTTTILNPISNTAASAGQQPEVIELVLGREKELLAWLAPVVRRQSVTLDLSRVRRIDAAGVSALLSLYSSAQKAGHRFSVANLSPRVAEVLRLVGLERIIRSHGRLEERFRPAPGAHSCVKMLASAT
jgi:anti-anti-sigma factor